MTEPTKTAPDAQPLVGASEAALMMGVELSTFSHLRRRETATENSKFPKPIAVLRCGPIWKTSEIKRFAAKYTAPRPGPKPTAAPRKPTKVVATAATKPPTKAEIDGNGHAKKVAAKKAPAKAAAISANVAMPTVPAKKVAAKRPAKKAALTAV
jgi:hypothetical protein